MISTRTLFCMHPSSVQLYQNLKGEIARHPNLWQSGIKAISNTENNQRLFSKIIARPGIFSQFKEHLEQNYENPTINIAKKVIDLVIKENNKKFISMLSGFSFREDEYEVGMKMWHSSFEALNQNLEMNDVTFKPQKAYQVFLKSIESSNLEVLLISNMKVVNKTSPEWLLELLQSISKMHEELEELSLAKCNLNNDGANVIAEQIKENRLNMRCLTLHENLIGDEGAINIVEEFIKTKNKHLWLAGNNISREAAKKILSMINSPY